MRRFFPIIVLAVVAVSLTGCKEQKKSDVIITKKAEPPKPQAPIRMQDYTQTKDVQWLGKNYQIEIKRVADDSLKMVKDETGQKFVDNRISLRVLRSDGSVFFSSGFTKAAFDSYLNDDYRHTGILEGFVFDKVEGNNLFFAASVCHPQTDEYIPLVVSLSNFGDVGIRLDNSLDTYGDSQGSTDDDDI